jgi:hypothetical protein
VIRPIPRGIDRNDLVGQYLGTYGQIKDIRFGSGRGVAGDLMYVDYFSPESAETAVSELDGKKDPGVSLTRLHVSITSSSLDAIKKLRATTSALRPPSNPTKTGASLRVLPFPPRIQNPYLKYLRPKSGRGEVCVIDISALEKPS